MPRTSRKKQTQIINGEGINNVLNSEKNKRKTTKNSKNAVKSKVVYNNKTSKSTNQQKKTLNTENIDLKNNVFII